MQLHAILSKTSNKPFHGGDTGSTPVRDATYYSSLTVVAGLRDFGAVMRGRGLPRHFI
jgi:hypothetical protein